MSFVINQNSWSFRFLKKYDSDISDFVDAENFQLENPNSYIWDSVPKTFCQYYRRVMWHIITNSLIVMLLTCMAVAFLSPTALLIPHLPKFFHDLFTAIGLGEAILIAVMLIIELSKSFFEKMRTRKYRLKTETTNKQSSVLVMMFKAWKQKYCPLVEYDFVKQKVSENKGQVI